ncbi:type I 3-dehydroquinate dehydratase [Halalkalibacter nanhaiisediminis]|uniref:3-dehydroquinate dehydratase n=1 Tax=Halalkalibacter nanhaiisediminis TaxID=688079 RepID=A0A562QBD9_9BACI|nr:type I 3-dehydroquinate dehydratase [Halalkalibacter nanhaiisediminis]TWI54085.1 3-dehydroquinate dehydratase [Halalkalibacter nanhaiisediminis]
MSDLRKIVKVRGREISGDHPHICVPLIGKNKLEIINELENVKQKKPDLIEWRADFFEDLDDRLIVMEMLSEIHTHMPDTPILFTIRSEKEGGQPISLLEEEKVQLMAEVCKSGKIDILDYELINEKQDIEFLREESKNHDIRFILSYHNFESTPDYSVLMDKYKEAELYGADIAKTAVMSQKLDDVLLLLQVTHDAKGLVQLPLVTMSMGNYGSLTRMFGFVFGSAITFGIGEKSSAPGQIPIEDLRSVIEIIKKSM